MHPEHAGGIPAQCRCLRGPPVEEAAGIVDHLPPAIVTDGRWACRHLQTSKPIRPGTRYAALELGDCGAFVEEILKVGPVVGGWPGLLA
jgi:hypothetical protein